MPAKGTQHTSWPRMGNSLKDSENPGLTQELIRDEGNPEAGATAANPLLPHAWRPAHGHGGGDRRAARTHQPPPRWAPSRSRTPLLGCQARRRLLAQRGPAAATPCPAPGPAAPPSPRRARRQRARPQRCRPWQERAPPSTARLSRREEPYSRLPPRAPLQPRSRSQRPPPIGRSQRHRDPERCHWLPARGGPARPWAAGAAAGAKRPLARREWVYRYR